jgi:hypothetical protein
MLWQFGRGIRGASSPIRPTTTGTNAADAEVKSKSSSTRQTLQKREIPNNDVPQIFRKMALSLSSTRYSNGKAVLGASV